MRINLVKRNTAMFRTLNTTPGFNITFENGFTASVQWGTHCYCERSPEKSASIAPGYDPFSTAEEVEARSATAEIAAIDSSGEFCKVKDWFEGDDVRGWVTPDEVAQFLSDVAEKVSE